MKPDDLMGDAQSRLISSEKKSHFQNAINEQIRPFNPAYKQQNSTSKIPLYQNCNLARELE